MARGEYEESAKHFRDFIRMSPYGRWREDAEEKLRVVEGRLKHGQRPTGGDGA
jgi:outer membrane protein assembly factor BamD (BamD/ComL family)